MHQNETLDVPRGHSVIDSRAAMPAGLVRASHHRMLYRTSVSGAHDLASSHGHRTRGQSSKIFSLKTGGPGTRLVVHVGVLETVEWRYACCVPQSRDRRVSAQHCPNLQVRTFYIPPNSSQQASIHLVTPCSAIECWVGSSERDV